MKKATLAFSDLDTSKTLEALKTEAQEGMKRVEIEVSTDPPKIQIEAEDSRALRAALNSYLRWLDISDEITTKFDQ